MGWLPRREQRAGSGDALSRSSGRVLGWHSSNQTDAPPFLERGHRNDGLRGPRSTADSTRLHRRLQLAAAAGEDIAQQLISVGSSSRGTDGHGVAQGSTMGSDQAPTPSLWVCEKFGCSELFDSEELKREHQQECEGLVSQLDVEFLEGDEVDVQPGKGEKRPVFYI